MSKMDGYPVAASEQINIILIEKSLNGDSDAFGELVKKYQDLIYGLIYYKVQNYSDAEDIAQNTFIKAFERLSQLDDPLKFEQWLKSIANNECKHWYRDHDSAISTDIIESLLFSTTQSINNWKRREEQTDVLRALNSLSKENRLVVTLYYLSGLSCHEISVSQGITVAAVEKRLSRARQQLRAEMLGTVENDFATHRLPESFTQDVLRRIFLYPIEDNWSTTIRDGDSEALVLGVKTPDKKTKFIKLSMAHADIEAIIHKSIYNNFCVSEKISYIQNILSTLDDSDIYLKEVVLSLDGEGKCIAQSTFQRNGIDKTVVLAPSDALCLALYAKAGIFAQQDVVKKEYVEDAGFVKMSEMTDKDLTRFMKTAIQITKLIDTAFENGLSPEHGINGFICQIDKHKNRIFIMIPDNIENEISLNLNMYAIALEHIVDQCWKNNKERYELNNGREYWVEYKINENSVIQILLNSINKNE